MKAIDIVWVTDGEEVNLPVEMELPSSIESDDFDAITDFLSDETGFLVESYNISEDNSEDNDEKIWLVVAESTVDSQRDIKIIPCATFEAASREYNKEINKAKTIGHFGEFFNNPEMSDSEIESTLIIEESDVCFYMADPYDDDFKENIEIREETLVK